MQEAIFRVKSVFGGNFITTHYSTGAASPHKMAAGGSTTSIMRFSSRFFWLFGANSVNLFDSAPGAGDGESSHFVCFQFPVCSYIVPTGVYSSLISLFGCLPAPDVINEVRRPFWKWSSCHVFYLFSIRTQNGFLRFLDCWFWSCRGLMFSWTSLTFTPATWLLWRHSALQGKRHICCRDLLRHL